MPISSINNNRLVKIKLITKIVRWIMNQRYNIKKRQVDKLLISAILIVKMRDSHLGNRLEQVKSSDWKSSLSNFILINTRSFIDD